MTFTDLVSYDPDTGLFTWLTYRGRRANAGSIAGTRTHKSGYVYIIIMGKRYAAHRLAWFMTFGSWPPHDIDHINGVRDDNRISNLREATRQENCRNSNVSKNNTSGCVGVKYLKRNKKWTAQITVNYTRLYLGIFSLKADAIAARKLAEQKYFGSFAKV